MWPQLILEDHLGGCPLPGFSVLCDVAVGEASFSEQSTFEVPPGHLGPVDSSDMLIDDVAFLIFGLAIGATSGRSMLAKTHLNFYGN